MLGRIVVDLANLDFPLLLRFEYRLDERRGGLAVGYLDDGEGAVVELLDFGTHLHAAAPLAVVVFGHIDEAAGLEIGIEVKLLAPQIGHGRFQNFVEIVGQNLRRQTHGNTFGPLGQQQGEFHRQGHRLLLAAVVGEFPLGCLGIEDDIEGKLREARLDVTGSGGRVAREDITPVSLAFDQQVLLPQLHQRVADRGVAVRVELHGVTHDIGHLVEAPVVEQLHGMENAPLHRLQPVGQVGNGPLEYDIRGIVEEPVLKHSRELELGVGLVGRRYLVGRVSSCRLVILASHLLTPANLRLVLASRHPLLVGRIGIFADGILGHIFFLRCGYIVAHRLFLD